MTLSRLLLLVLITSLATAGCRCDDGVRRARPTIDAVRSLSFGQVKVGSSAEATVKVLSQTQAPLTVSSVTLESGSAPGGASAFTILASPTTIPALGQDVVRLRFDPTALEAYEAVLVIASNDEENPSVRVLISGEGAKPVLTVTPECSAAKRCEGSAVAAPPSLSWAPEPFTRQLQLPVTQLPNVSLVNDGPVELVITAPGKSTEHQIQGRDKAAFTFAQDARLPDRLADDTPALILQPGTGINLPIRFKPTSEQQASYEAELVVLSDDQDKPEVRIKLSGTLRPNQPPVVCANIVRVLPGDGSGEINYGTQAHWEALIPAPAGGYDFASSRDVQPKSTVTFSAVSDADQTRCSNDPEDGRIGVAFRWELVSAPAGSARLTVSGPANPTATLTPVATGEYLLRLTVTDAQGHATSTTLRFLVAIKEDLVAQLSWGGADGGFAGIDLDLHLVRPSAATDPNDPFSGAFAFFESGAASKTAGDIHGYARLVARNNPGAGFDFDWGQVGTFDDPRLNLDDTGSADLIENISLNYPENDPRCATSSCTYKVMVHYFRDARPQGSPPACTVSGCRDGDPCGCPSGLRCVANDAPADAGPSGAGKCFAPPQPVVRLFVKANPTPLQIIPLEGLTPPDPLAIPSPCQLLHVADVIWPSRASISDAGGVTLDGGRASPTAVVRGLDGGRVVSPELARYGFRQTGSLQCSPNVKRNGTIDWYAEEP